jgi:hypothetical protein
MRIVQQSGARWRAMGYSVPEHSSRKRTPALLILTIKRLPSEESQPV